MTIDASFDFFRSLAPSDRRMIAETILDELDVTNPEPLSNEELEFIGQRLEAYRRNPEGARPYDEVVSRIRAKYGR